MNSLVPPKNKSLDTKLFCPRSNHQLAHYPWVKTSPLRNTKSPRMNDESSRPVKPLDEIPYHPHITFWGGILTLSIDLHPTPLQTPSLMRNLANILLDYAPWTHHIKISILPPPYQKDPDPCSTTPSHSHISDFKTIINILNKFDKVKELHLIILLRPQESKCEDLYFLGGLFGLERIKWSLAFAVEGNGKWEIDAGCCFMRELLEVYSRRFSGSGGLEMIVE
ncbi:uncharacterized protein Bfra_008492 [Botrytis fragariae]|uniref:Uncharacterized protein n=1 Tax=Botrytis fragariae TaxID=1964551 RepID=A0A8H6EI87_9HELO|nr:uncharacterized protein Bfra_008492 [Botrytis fragariae]KAF5873213.1 hypothetical protein Bfra_008492 [Botrytis fragariae]